MSLMIYLSLCYRPDSLPWEPFKTKIYVLQGIMFNNVKDPVYTLYRYINKLCFT